MGESCLFGDTAAVWHSLWGVFYLSLLETLWSPSIWSPPLPSPYSTEQCCLGTPRTDSCQQSHSPAQDWSAQSPSWQLYALYPCKKKKKAFSSPCCSKCPQHLVILCWCPMYSVCAGRAVPPVRSIGGVWGTLGLAFSLLRCSVCFLSPSSSGKFTSFVARSGYGACLAHVKGPVQSVCCRGTNFTAGHSSLKLQAPLKADCPLDLGLQTVGIGSPAKLHRALPACFCVVNRCAVTPFACAGTRRTLWCTGSSGITVSLELSDLEGFRGGELCVCSTGGNKPVWVCPPQHITKLQSGLARAALLVPASPGPAPHLC